MGSVKANVKSTIGKCTVVSRQGAIEVVTVETDDVCFTIEYNVVTNECYDRHTKDRLITKTNFTGSFTNILATKESFINQQIYALTITRFEDGSYTVGCLVKTKKKPIKR